MKMGKNERVIKQAIIERNAKKFLLLLLVSLSLSSSLSGALCCQSAVFLYQQKVSFSPKSRAALEEERNENGELIGK
tara:strand:- start:36 stop:266 length:231 start_codon:yes stop_codon:yes gene_type:complete